MFKRKDWLIIVVALLMALGLFVLTRSGIRLGVPGKNDPLRILTELPSPTAQNGQETAVQAEPIALLVLTVGDTRYSPLPIHKETSYRLHQSNGRDNVIHVAPDSIFMESANCDNQDCIKQGTVNLDNRDTRVLNNMIICLPNQVVLELITPEEAGEQPQ